MKKSLFKYWQCAFFLVLIAFSLQSKNSAYAADPFLIAAATTTSSEYSPESREYHLKGAFLRYVVKFIEWPTETLPEATINICILGQVPSFDGINSINGKIVNDRAISIIKITSIEEGNSSKCQLVFVSKTETDQMGTIITALVGKPVLSFGDMDQFSAKGGSMNFYIANNRLAIMANLPKVEKNNLKVNPEMLKLITVVPPEG